VLKIQKQRRAGLRNEKTTDRLKNITDGVTLPVGFVKYKAHERRNGGCSSDRARKLLVVAKGWRVYLDKKK